MTTEGPLFTEPGQYEEAFEAEVKARQTPAEIRRSVEEGWNDFRRRAAAQHFEAVLDGVEKIYSTSQAAAFLGRSPQWIYWGLREEVFTYKDGTPIKPERVGKMERRRFTLPLIREIALSHFRRGNMTESELEEVMKKVLLAEFGPDAFSDTSKDSTPVSKAITSRGQLPPIFKK